MSKEPCLQFEVVSSMSDRIYSYKTSDFVDATTRLRNVEESGDAIGIAKIDKINRIIFF